jgi:carboxypeptidase PM20D1
MLFLVAMVLLRTARFALLPKPAEPAPALEIDANLVAEHIGLAIRCETVSYQTPVKGFITLHHMLEETYPRAHAALKREVINGYSLLYTWPGHNLELEPVLLAGHLDVAPVDPAQAADWLYPPFSGQVAEGYVWGRGALDDKGSVVAMFEAVEYLLEEGFQPERTIYLAFGHDEEIGGAQGAKEIAARLLERDIQPGVVLDEGLGVSEGVLPGVKAPVALIGTGEKGYLSLELVVEKTGGHSATPSGITPIGVLGEALHNLNRITFRPRTALARRMLRSLAPALPFGWQMVLANRWLFGERLERWFASSPTGLALLHTTSAITMVSGGIKDNVLPASAQAVINFRLMPGDSLRSAFEKVLDAVDNLGVTVRPLSGDTLEGPSGWNPPPVTDPNSDHYALVASLVQQTFPEALVAPILSTGAADARYYTAVSPHVLRFSCERVTPADLERVHGINERLSLEDSARMVGFYALFMKELGK